VVWEGLFEKLLEVVHWRPCLSLVTACGSLGASLTRAARLTIIAIGHDPLKALLAPLSTSFDALLCVVGGDVGWHLPVAAWGHLPTSLSKVKHDRLIASGALDEDATWFLGCVPEGVATSALPRALHVTLGQRALITLASLTVSLGLAAPSRPPWQGLGCEISRGDGARLIMDGIAIGFGRLAPA
jgi:hypothetical protein